MAFNVRSKKNNSWNIDYLKVIYSKEPNNFYTFKLESWVEKNQKINAIINPQGAVSITPGKTTAISATKSDYLTYFCIKISSVNLKLIKFFQI